MGGDQTSVRSELQEQVDELRRTITQNRALIDSLRDRADASELRAEASAVRMDELDQLIDIDRAVIAELLAGGRAQQAHAHHLELALQTSRTIGAAVGIIMANFKVDQHEAFAILRRASQDSNTKLSSIADDVATTGDVSRLPLA